MPPTPARPGAPCWIDLFTSDPDAAKAFYGGLLGWEAEDMGEEYGGYVNFLRDGARTAGCMRNDGSAGAPDVWTVYLATADAGATADAATAQGGHVLVPAMPVMTLGSMLILQDPGGAAVGGWQAGEHLGFPVVAEPGAPSWFELLTHRYDESVAFYREVFEWDAQVASDEPTFRYTTLGAGEEQAAGIMDAKGHLGEEVPSHWRVYLEVADIDASVAQVEHLGGAVLGGPFDTPYGRLAEVADTTGARFSLRQS